MYFNLSMFINLVCTLLGLQLIIKMPMEYYQWLCTVIMITYTCFFIWVSKQENPSGNTIVSVINIIISVAGIIVMINLPDKKESLLFLAWGINIGIGLIAIPKRLVYIPEPKKH